MRDLLLGCTDFSLVVACRFSHSSCGMRAPERVGSIVCSTWAPVETCELSSCGAWAQLPRGTWDLSSLTRARARVPGIVRRILCHWTTREVPASFLKLFRGAIFEPISKYSLGIRHNAHHFAVYAEFSQQLYQNHYLHLTGKENRFWRGFISCLI